MGWTAARCTVECNNTQGTWNYTYSNRCRVSEEEEERWEDQRAEKDQQSNTLSRDVVATLLVSVDLARRTQRLLGREFASVHKARRKTCRSRLIHRVERGYEGTFALRCRERCSWWRVFNYSPKETMECTPHLAVAYIQLSFA